MKEVVATSPASNSFLTVGHPLKMALASGEQKAVFGSTLLGWKEHAWLVCEWPAQLGHETDIPRGTACTISYLHDGKLVAYQSVIRDLVRLPVPLLFLAFPTTVEEMHLRKHTRVPSCEPALLMRAEGGSCSTRFLPSCSDYTGGVVKDFSLGGCSIAVITRPSWLRPGSTIRMEFELPGLGHVTNLAGMVKNAVAADNAEVLGVAFQFDGMEYIEYRGWGGTVQEALARCVEQKHQGSLDLQ